LEGGHLIKLGPGNDEAAKDALRTWPGPLWFCPHWVADHECIKYSEGLQIGGGITDKNALSWIECGASKVSLVIWNLYNNRAPFRLSSPRICFPNRSSLFKDWRQYLLSWGRSVWLSTSGLSTSLYHAKNLVPDVNQLPTERTEVDGSNE
jgi:hypothetical protein